MLITALSNCLLLLGLAAVVIVAFPWSLPLVWLAWKIWKTS